MKDPEIVAIKNAEILVNKIFKKKRMISKGSQNLASKDVNFKKDAEILIQKDAKA